MAQSALPAARPIPCAVKLVRPLQFAGALSNLWIGIACAGYTVREDASIFLVVFGLPALAGLPILWPISRIAR